MMVVLCDGMVRSGSTWSFNVALELLRSCAPDRKTFGLYNENPAVLLAAARPRSSHLVIKSHHLDPSTHVLCRSGAIKAIYTWRNPYDTIASCVQMFGNSVEHWTGAVRNALRVWSFHEATGSACIVAYESILTAPSETVYKISSYLGVEVGDEKAHQIAEALSLNRLKNFTQRIDELGGSRVIRKDGYVYDRRTLLHHNHIRDGRIGYGAGILDPNQLPLIDGMLREEGFGFLCAAGAPVGSGVAPRNSAPHAASK